MRFFVVVLALFSGLTNYSALAADLICSGTMVAHCSSNPFEIPPDPEPLDWCGEREATRFGAKVDLTKTDAHRGSKGVVLVTLLPYFTGEYRIRFIEPDSVTFVELYEQGVWIKGEVNASNGEFNISRAVGLKEPVITVSVKGFCQKTERLF